MYLAHNSFCDSSYLHFPKLAYNQAMNERCLECSMFRAAESDVAARARALGVPKGISSRCMFVEETGIATLTMSDCYRDLETGDTRRAFKVVSSTAPEFCPQR